MLLALVLLTMQKSGERFSTKGKSLLTKFNMKVINTLDLRKSTGNIPRYNRLRDDLINVQEQLSGSKRGR